MIKFSKVINSIIEVLSPSRGSKGSAGYDFKAPKDFVIPAHGKSELIWLDFKLLIPMDKFLKIENRSSMVEKDIILWCGGVVDADYYGNDKNDGNIGVRFRNFGDKDILIKKDEKICQGIILPYYVTFDDKCNMIRHGGFGSTGV